MAYLDFDELMGGSCDDEVSWAAIIGRHAIKQTDFDSRVVNQFGSNPEPAITISITVLQATGVDCKTKSWRYNENARSNNNINLTLDNIRTDHQYSIQLFRGLNRWFDAVDFDFTLGKDSPTGRRSVIFVARNNLNTAVYYGNISNLHP